MKTFDSSLLVIKNRAIALMLQLLERLGYPVSLRDLIISMPAFRASELPSYKSIAVGDITNWSDWGGYPLTDKITNRSLNPHAEILGRVMHSGLYKSSMRTVPAMQKLTLINEIPSWECEIQEVEGISNSKSDIYSFETLDQMVATNSKKMITPVSDEKLRENLEWQEIRIIHAKYAGDHFEKFSWDDRVFLINSGGSHHFAAARYIASRIKENIQLEGRLVTHTLNADAVQELRAEFEIFLISKSCAVQAAFVKIMRSLQATYYLHNMPRPYNEDFYALFLPKSERVSSTVAKTLTEANMFNIGEHLTSLCLDQSDLSNIKNDKTNLHSFGRRP